MRTVLDRSTLFLAGALFGLFLVHFFGGEQLASLFFWLSGLFVPSAIGYAILASGKGQAKVKANG